MFDRQLKRTITVTVAFLLCYASVLWSIASEAATNSQYSYALVVPLISGYIVWLRWPAIVAALGAPDYLFGVPLVLAGLALQLTGNLAALAALEEISLLLTLTGLVLLLAGRNALRVVWFPIGYLMLMLPVWSYVVSSLQGPSQQISATIAARLLQTAGVPAFLQGTTIVLPTVTLDVMAECSGTNQLVALLVMALPLSYLWLATSGSRLMVVAIAVIVGYLSNGARIAVIGWLTPVVRLVRDPHSVAHLIPGFLTASLAYLAIYGCVVLLSRLNRRKPGAPVIVRSKTGESFRLRTSVEAALVIAMVGVGAAKLWATPVAQQPIEGLASIPRTFDVWASEALSDSRVQSFAGFEDDLLGGYPTESGHRFFVGLDDQLLRAYENPVGKQVDVFIGYYASQRNGKEVTGDVSMLLHQRATAVSVRSDSVELTVNEVVQSRQQGSRGVIFWYDINGRILPNVYLTKTYSLWDTLTRRRNNAAVVMIAWDTSKNGTRQDAIAFAESLLRVLRRHLPS